MAKVTIQYWAAAREAAGVELESVEAGTLAEALDAIVARRGDDSRLRAVLDASSFLVDGAAASRGAGKCPSPTGGIVRGVPPRVGESAVLRQTGWTTPYSVRTSTFRSHIAVPHEPARTAARPPGIRGCAR